MYAPLCEVWMNSYQKHTRDNSSNFQFAFSQNVSKLSYEVLAVNPRYILKPLFSHSKSRLFLSQILPCKYLPWPTSILFYDQLGLTSIKVDWEERFHCTHEHCRHMGRKLIGDDGKTGCDERGGSQGFHGTHQEAHHDEYGAWRTFIQGPVGRNIYWFSERTALWLSQLHLKRNFPVKTHFCCLVLLRSTAKSFL